MNFLSKENVQELLSLSPLQEQMVQQSPASIVDLQLTQVVSTWTTRLDATVFQQAWDQVIARHPGLRTVFRMLKNRDVQVVLKTRPIPVEEFDLGHLSATQQQAALLETACAHRAPFRLEEGPLMRLALFHTGDAQSVFLWTFHDIVLDEVSRHVVFADLLTAYEALVGGKQVTLPNRPLFKDYLSWLGQQDFTAAKAEWSAHLATFELPTPAPVTRLERVETLDVHAKQAWLATRSLAFTPELSQALDALATKQGVTRDVLVQSAWALLLNVHSGEEEVRFGLVVNDRASVLNGASQPVGRLANTMPCHVQVDGKLRVDAMLQALHQQTERLRRYASLPLAKIRAYGGLAADVSLFDSTLAVIEASTSDGSVGKWATQTELYRSQPHALALTVATGDTWTVTAAFAVEEVAADSVERILQQFRTLLESLTLQSEATVSELNLLSDSERQQLFHDFNQSKLPNPPLDPLAHQVFEQQAARRPDAIAAVCGDRRVTYGELNAQANRLAHWLREQDFGRDDIAALLAERSIEMLTAILAVLKAGGAYVPLDSAHPDARVLSILESSRAKVILTQTELWARSHELAQQMTAAPAVFNLDSATAASDSQANPVFQNEPHDLANVFFTSGSTGQPKGAMVEHIGMLNHLYAKINLLGLSESSVVVQNASHCFDISVWQFLAALMVGGQVVIYPNDVAIDPQALLRSVCQDGVTVLEMVPAMIEMFLQAAAETGASELPALQYMISTGEGLPTALGRKWLRTYPHVTVINTYGATECSDDTNHEVITASDLNEEDGVNFVTLGTPIPHFKLYLLDKWQRPVPLGCVGEVCLTGIGVGRGYLNDPERTAQSFVPNPFADGMSERMYKTGDLARFLPDGRLAFVSRIDFQVKVRGHRIELGEVEAALLKHPAVSQGVALVRPDAAGQNRILAYVVENRAGEIDVPAMRDFLHTVLPPYMLPEHIRVLNALPLTRNGKVDRKALPDPDESTTGGRTYLAPRNERERALADIWAGVLEVSEVGIDDNFFALGGHSLKMMQVRTRIGRLLGLDVPLMMLFEHRTVRELAEALDRMENQTGTQAEQAIPRLPEAESYPISHAQKRLFLIDRLEPHNTTYHLPVGLELHGRVEASAVEQALQMIVDRHASLRTTFAIVNGEPMQKILSNVKLSYHFDDLSDEKKETHKHLVNELIAAERKRGFDLEQGPLFRVRQIQVSADRHLLLLNMHHIVSDGWSGQVLLKEFSALYEAACQGQPNPLPPLAIQYVDFAAWQTERFAKGELAASEQFWLQQFSGELPVLNLPTDRPRPPVQSFAGHTQEMTLSAELLNAIHELCREQEATLFMGLLAVTGLFLSRLSGQEDIVVGTPEAGRNRVELEELIGFFVNTLAIRLDMSGHLTFTELLQRVKRTAIDVYAHQEYPFDLLVERLNPVRDMSRSPLFSVMFQVLRAAEEAQEVGNGLHIEPFPIGVNGAHFDLSLTFAETEAGLEGHFEYSTDLFDAETIARWMGHFQTLLEQIIADPARPITALPMLSEAEQQQLLVWQNGSDSQAPDTESCLHHLFEAQVAAHADKVALIAEDGELTYRELNGRANQLAHRLLQLGVGPESKVAVCLERTTDLVVSQLGILKAGGAYVPLDPSYPQERMELILGDTQAPVLITQTSVLPLLPAHQAQVICVDRDRSQLAAEPQSNPEHRATPANLAYMIYTSGSTGRPKAVMVEHRQIISELTMIRDKYGYTDADVMPCIASATFDISVFEMYTTLIAGGTLLMLSKEHLLDLPRLTETVAGSTLFHAVPSLMRQIVQEFAKAGAPQPHRLRHLYTGGDLVPPELLNDLQDTFPQADIHVIYGPTETTIVCTSFTVPRHVHMSKSLIGRPYPNARTRIYDANQQAVPIGVPGELYIGGPIVTRGYYGREDLTAEKFVVIDGERWYRSGDLTRYLPDGNIEFLGRIDNQVKIRGFRIELGEVEEVLTRHPSVAQTVALPLEVANDKQLVACVAIDPQAGLDLPTPNDLRHFLLEKLPEYMVPSLYVLFDTLPVNSNGKIDRRQLQIRAHETLQRTQGANVAPRDRVELEMVAIWEDVLQMRAVGLFDNFFAIGGHSLKAVVLMEAIRKHFAVDLPLAALFQAPTIADLCQRMRGGEEPTDSCIITIQEGRGGDASLPPLFLLHPQGGGVLSYFHLAKALGAEQTVYGVQAIGYESDDEPLTTMQEMGERYLAEIKQVVPVGPYRLAGWSFGGALAFEITRLLEANGEQVEFLGLFDVLPFHELQQHAGPQNERMALEQYATLIDLDPAELATLDDEQALQQVLRHAREHNHFPAGTSIESMRRKVRVMMLNGIASFQTHTQTTLHTDLHLYRVSEAATKLFHPLVDPSGWERYTAGEVHVTTISGDHHSLVNPPHVLELATAMKQHLQDLQREKTNI